MALYDDLEEMCGRIKHTSDQVDLSEVRMLLRRSQYYIDQVIYVLGEVEVSLPGNRLARLIEESTAGGD